MATSTFTIQSDFRSAFHIANLIIHPNFFPCRRVSPTRLPFSPRRLLSSNTTSFRLRAFSTDSADSAITVKLPEKPPVCTADELHYVSVANSHWHLALWRYRPPPQVAQMHALLISNLSLSLSLS